jgi:hypothetical protein
MAARGRRGIFSYQWDNYQLPREGGGETADFINSLRARVADPDPHRSALFGMLDPGPHYSEKLDPDLHSGALEAQNRAVGGGVVVAHIGGLEAHNGAPEGL